MGRIYRFADEFDEKSEGMLERAFKEGCEHGYRKAMRECGSYEERANCREGFEETMERLKRKYR